MLLPAASTLESLGSFYLFILFKNLLLFFKFYFVFKLYMGQENPLEKGMATDSSVLAWSIP